MTGGQLGHLSGADEKNSLALEGAEYLAREVDGHGSDGDRAGADLGFTANLFGYGEGALEQRFEMSRDGAYLACDGIGVFDLTKNLGLADDHAVEGAGHAEKMTDGFTLAEFVEVRLDVVRRDGEVFVEEAEEIGVCRGGGAIGRVVLEGEEFDAVAGGKDEAFADAGLVEKGAGGIGEAARGDG